MGGYLMNYSYLQPPSEEPSLRIEDMLSDTMTDTVTDLWNSTALTAVFDPRDFAYPGDIRKRPLWEILLKVKSYFVIMIVALIGNLTVIVTVVKNRRLRTTTTNLYILNLALCDVMVTVCCTWVHLVDDLREGWVLGAFFCKTNSFSQVLSLVASILTLTVLACDRFFGIVFAMKARVTERRSKVIIALLWLFSIIISLPLLIYRREFSRQWANHEEIWCGDEWPEMTSSPVVNGSMPGLYSKKIYYTTVSLILYFLPSVIMTVAYGVIMRTLWANKLPGEHISCMEHAQNRKKKKVIVMLLTMLLVFILCWFPFHVSILYSEYRDSLHKLPAWYPTFQYIAVFMADSNCAFNPIIYTCFNKSFKSGFKETFRKRQQRESTRWKRETIRHSCQSTSSTFYQTIEMKHYFARHNRL